MNRLNLFLSRVALAAIIWFFISSSAAFAQVNYTVTGIVTLTSGPDLLGFNGTSVYATATLTQTTAPSNSTVTSTSSTNTYDNVTGITLNGLSCGASPPVAVTLTDNAGAADTISISSCTIEEAVVTATATIPNGAMNTAVPSAIPFTNNVSGTMTYTLNGGEPSVFNISGGTILATGTPPPTVTPSLTSWTPPTVSAGSTTPLSQTVTFSTGVPDGAVSFLTSATTTTGGNWLSVTPAAINSSSSITITANPSGLSGGSYSGSVTLTYGSDVTPTVIPVTLTISGGSTSNTALTGPASMTFNYTPGATAPASQTLSIGTSPASSTSVSAAVTSGSSWLSVSPASGATPASFTVSVNTAGLTTAQTLNGNIQITASGVNNSPLNIPVSYVISATALTVTSTPLTFNYTIGGSTPAAQSVSITGTSGLAFTTSTGTASAWLSATPSGTVPSSISVSINAAGLSGLKVGQYTGTVTVTSAGASGSPASIPVTLNVTGPSLTATPSQLSFSYQLGATTQPAAQTISVGDTSNVNFTATTSGGSWLSVTPGTGSASGNLSVSVNASGLTANTYYGTVTIAATGATPQVVNVSLVVSMPDITVNASSLSFAYQTGTTAPAAQLIMIGGTSNLAFTATAAGGSWLAVTPGSGTTGSSISVSVNTSGLTAKTYNGTVTIAAPGATSQVVSVTLVVSNTPTISASPSALNFTYQLGGTAPTAQSVNIAGSAGLEFTATATGGSWLSVTPGSGTTPGAVSVAVNTSGLTANTYNATITIAASGVTSQTVNVTLIVSNEPAITASPSSLSFSYAIGSTLPAAQSLNIGGIAGAAFTATGGASWLGVTPGSGTMPSSISVSVNPATLTAGTYHGNVAITAAGTSNSPFSIPVTLTITGVAPTITLSASSLNFSALTGASAPASQTVNVSSSAASSLSLGILGGSWLTASLSASTTPAVVTVSANQANLAAGSYVGSVVITAAGASNSPQTIAVQLVVSSTTALTATPASLGFAYVFGNANPPAQTINLTGTQPLTFSTSVPSGSWLTVSGASTTTPAALSVSVTPGSLAAGTYNASITITSSAASNSPLTVPVTLVVSSKPALAASPNSLTFAAQTGGANPGSQSVNLIGSSTLPFTITTSPSWLTASVASGTTPSTLIATVNAAGMSQGSYQGAITVTSNVAGNSPLSIPVTLTVSTPLVVTGPSISNIVNAASYDASGFSPGAIVSIFGSSLGPQTGVSFSVSPQGSVSTTLSGASVTVAGIPAIPIFVQSGQVNVILPYTLGSAGQATVSVEYNNLTSTEFTIPLTPADVQIFTANASGSGPGSILNQDYSVNSASNPAAPGSVVQVFGTGGGAVSPVVTAGNVAGDTLAWISAPYSAAVNGENATVLYAGSAPGLLYGVYQFNVQLPADLPAGADTIVLNVDGSLSQSDVTVFVK
jgi:uncharacterized protein (TIGR03437 family)